ncbi:MAG TPA: DNA-binding protein [Candidatus Brocadiia bacterium]|nr:DNA-binding protein [Candidatus Brocadiia bacterium]
MEYFTGIQIEDIIAIRLDQGDDIIESIRKLARKLDIQTGVIVSCVATVDRAAMHYITTTGYPAENEMYELEGPIEVAALQGIIADYEPHLHCVMGIGEKTYAGHMHAGCRTLYLTEIVVHKLRGCPLQRVKNTDTGIMQLKPRL